MKHVKLSPKWRGRGRRQRERAPARARAPPPGPGNPDAARQGEVTTPRRPTCHPAGGARRVPRLSLSSPRVGGWPSASLRGPAGGIYTFLHLPARTGCRGPQFAPCPCPSTLQAHALGLSRSAPWDDKKGTNCGALDSWASPLLEPLPVPKQPPHLYLGTTEVHAET